jgi:hypothetical protein
MPDGGEVTEKAKLLTKFLGAVAEGANKATFNLGIAAAKNLSTYSQAQSNKIREVMKDFCKTKIANNPKEAHEFLVELSSNPALKTVISTILFKNKLQCENFKADRGEEATVYYADDTNKGNITTAFNYVIQAERLNKEIQQGIREELFDEKGEIRPKFTGTKDEVEKSIYALCDAVYESKKQHAAYSELKWPAFMLWGAIFRFVVSTLAEKDPVYLYLLEPEKKLDNSSTRFLPMRG